MERLRTQTGIARQLAPAAREVLARHSWPGNVRELENAIVRAVFLAAGDIVAEIPGLHSTSRVRSRPTTGRSRDDERRRIVEALEREDWNVRRVAQILGIPRATFYRRLERYKIERAS